MSNPEPVAGTCDMRWFTIWQYDNNKSWKQKLCVRAVVTLMWTMMGLWLSVVSSICFIYTLPNKSQEQENKNGNEFHHERHSEHPECLYIFLEWLLVIWRTCTYERVIWWLWINCTIVNDICEMYTESSVYIIEKRQITSNVDGLRRVLSTSTTTIAIARTSLQPHLGPQLPLLHLQPVFFGGLRFVNRF